MTIGRLTCAASVPHTPVVATVGDRFQVVIERDARRKLRVKPGDRAVETVENGRLVITFLPPKHRRSMLGRLAGPGEIADFADYWERNIVGETLAREDREKTQ